MFEKKAIFIQLRVMIFAAVMAVGIIVLVEKGLISDKAYVFMFFIILLSAIFGSILNYRYQRSKVFRDLIEDELKNNGYELLSERPLRFSEVVETLDVKPTILINGIPIAHYSYKSRNERILHVRTTQEDEFSLHAIVTLTWKNNTKLDIRKKVKLN